MLESLVTLRDSKDAMNSNKAYQQDLLEKCKALHMQGLTRKEIAAQTGANELTLKTWIKRYEWPKLKEDTERIVERIGKETVSQRLRKRLNDEMESQMSALERDRPKRAKEVIQGRAKAVKAVAETIALVNGWANEKGNAMIQVNILNQVTTAEAETSGDDDAIDV